MLKRLNVILLANGLIALVGCSLIPQMVSIDQGITTTPIGCPPVIPNLPDINESSVVILNPNDQEVLLIYFLEVERCSSNGLGHH